MASFTDNFFSNTKITNKSNTTSKKKKEDEDELYTSFTESFFNNSYDDYYKSAGRSQYASYDDDNTVYSEEFINEYNSFVDRMNKGAKERYDEQVAKTESAAMYYSANKNKLIEERNKNLIYNWNINESGGTYFDYGATPKQDKNGYLKQTDPNGNVYWVDIKNDLLYDSNYKLINDDRLKNKEFMSGLKYEYDENNKLNSKYLSTQDKLGLNKIDASRYMSIVNNELYDTKNVNKNKNQVFNSIPESTKYGNGHIKEGWIIDEGKYYKPVSNNLMDYKPNGKTIKIKDNKVYELVENEIPKKLSEKSNTNFEFEDDNKPFKIQKPNINEPFKNNFQSPTQIVDYNQLSADIYKNNFEKLNKAIEEGKLTTANNAIEVINEKYFGHKISDGYIYMLGGNTEKNIAWFSKKFADNVEELEVINNSIANTSDANTLNELNKEKDRLELENTLIQYNRILAQQSAMNKVNKIDKMYESVDEAWDKVGKLWNSTFEEFDDGYQLGDLFGTVKNIFNNSIQSIGALGVQTNTGIQALVNAGLSDMDDSEFKDKWLPAIVDVGTYIIPYVGQARFIVNLAEPGAVAESWITQEGSATIESSDGDPRVASAWNGIGAIVNIGANILSNEIFKGIRVRLGEEGTKKIYENTAKGIATLIFKDATGEGVEEFVQTYAEVLQNTENVGDIDWKQTTKEGLEAALIAFITSGLASGASIGIDTIRTGDIKGTMLKHAELDNISQDGEIENVRINKDLADNKKVIYSSTDTKGYNDIKPDGLRTSDVTVDTDEQVAIDIATELENNQIVTILNSDAITKDTNIKLDDTSGTISLADSVINNNIKYALVGSKEMETYIKSLRPDLTTITFDPKSKTFMDDVRAYVKDVAKTNIVPKNVKDFTVNDYKLTPTEVSDINNFVNESLNRGNFSDSINNPDLVKFDPIKTSDITDSDINTIMNTIKTKFLNEIDNNKITKETAQKEFKKLNERISDYVLKAKQDRTYLKDSKNNIIVFSKKGDNFYEAVNTLPKGTADLSLLANVKTNGNIINGNLSTKVEFANKQLNAVNTLIDKLKLKGNYLTPDSTYKDVASLVKMNRDFSGAILQSLNADGLIEGQAKTRLYTAFNNLDNANMNQAIKNTANHLKSESFNKELDKKVKTTAPRTVDLKPEESKVSVEEKPINVKEYANNPANPSELNNIELEKLLDDSFKDLQIKNKISKDNAIELKNMIKNAIFDGYSHIVDIANTNDDYAVKKAIYDMQAVASDAQVMINGAQMKDGEIIGKALKQIYPDNNIKTKKDKELFEKIMLHALNAERENAGVDKIFENISAKQSEAIVKNAFAKHPNFKEAANDLQRYNNNLLNMLVDGGVISQELSNKLKNRYKYYMPIYSSELSTFVDLDSNKYLKQLSLDNSIKDVTKTGKQILSLEKSMENKTYNVLSAIAKNKLAQEIHNSGKYTGDSDLLFYDNGQLTKTKVSKEILSDISNNKASHMADVMHDIPVLKQLIDLSNLSYKFILDPIYQIKNITIDFTDSALVYSKDKAHFIPNYFKAIHAVANNSEAFHDALNRGLGNIGEGWTAPKVNYDSNGNITTKQNKFQRVYANLEAMPKIAEYFSLKDKYMKQAKADYEAGKYKIVDNHLEFNKDEQYAINKWKGFDSYTINEYLREGLELPENFQNISNNLDSVLNKIKSESGTFNRSIPLSGEKLQSFINKYKQGSIVKEDAFTSMSKDIVYDDSFNIQMKIKSNNAKDTSKLMRASENEFMLKRGSEFKVDKVNIISPTSKRGQDFNKFNEAIVKGHNGKPVYISRHTSTPDEIDYIKTYKQNNDRYGWWYANSPTGNEYYNSNESNKFMNDLFDKSTVEMINDKKGVFATISEKYLTPPSQEEISASGHYNYIEGYLTGKIFDISSDEGYLPFDVSNESEIDTQEKFENLQQKRRDAVTQIYTNLKNKYDKNNKYSLDDFRKYIPLIDALKLDGYTGIVSDYNNGTKEIVIFNESKFMPLKEYNELSNKNTTIELELTDVTEDNTTLYKNNVSLNDIQEKILNRAMLDASDVNLNFNRGGKVTKALSKSGFKFLNAGIQGFDKFVTHVSDGVKTPKGMGSLLLEFTAVGIGTAVANAILNGDDEEYDKLPYYYKNNYYMFKVGDNQYFRIPKGRVQALYDVIFEYATGLREEDSAKDYFESLTSALDSAVLPPALESASPISAYVQLFENKDAFGNEIYSKKYDTTGEKIQKSIYHLLSNYFGRYGRIVKDVTDGDSTTDLFNEFDFYKDTTKANKHYSTALSLVEYYQNSDNVKTLDDKAMKKYIDTQNYALRSINSEINQGKKSGLKTQDLKMKYAARDDLLLSMINNYKNFDKEIDDNGNTWYYFDEYTFMYNEKTQRFVKK